MSRAIIGTAEELPSPSGYDAFYRAVAAAQLASWLPETPCHVVDLSGESWETAGQMRDLGHRVTQVLAPGQPRIRDTDAVVGDVDLGWCRPSSVDAVIAEHGALSSSLATEVTLAGIARAIRPGGMLLLCLHSLLLGCSTLAEAGLWAELSDVPSADVVLVPTRDGSYTRCFGPDDIRDLVSAAGFAVEWLRPRTVLSEQLVTETLRDHPDRLAQLVRTEIDLESRRHDESVGIHLVVGARKLPT